MKISVKIRNQPFYLSIVEPTIFAFQPFSQMMEGILRFINTYHQIGAYHRCESLLYFSSNKGGMRSAYYFCRHAPQKIGTANNISNLIKYECVDL